MNASDPNLDQCEAAERGVLPRFAFRKSAEDIPERRPSQPKSCGWFGKARAYRLGYFLIRAAGDVNLLGRELELVNHPHTVIRPLDGFEHDCASSQGFLQDPTL